MFTWGGWAHPIAFCSSPRFCLLWQRTRGGRSLSQWAAAGPAGRPASSWCGPRPCWSLLFPLLEWLGRAAAPSRAASALRLARRRARASPPWWRGRRSARNSRCGKRSRDPGSPRPTARSGDFHDWLHPDFAGLLFSTAQHGLLRLDAAAACRRAGLVGAVPHGPAARRGLGAAPARHDLRLRLLVDLVDRHRLLQPLLHRADAALRSGPGRVAPPAARIASGREWARRPARPRGGLEPLPGRRLPRQRHPPGHPRPVSRGGRAADASGAGRDRPAGHRRRWPTALVRLGPRRLLHRRILRAADLR